jgi:hypothetical protein
MPVVAGKLIGVRGGKTNIYKFKEAALTEPYLKKSRQPHLDSLRMWIKN